MDTAAGQDYVWTLDLFSVLKRRVSCRVLTRINTWEINWNNQFSAGIKAWLHKGKMYNPQVGQDSVFIRTRLYFLCFCVCFINTSLLSGSQGCLLHLLQLWPLTFGLLPVVCLTSWRSFCCCKSPWKNQLKSKHVNVTGFLLKAWLALRSGGNHILFFIPEM